MLISQSLFMPRAFLLPNVVNGDTKLHPFVSISSRSSTIRPRCCTHSHSNFIRPALGCGGHNLKSSPCFSVSRKSGSEPDPDPNSEDKAKPKTKRSQVKTRISKNEDENPEKSFPRTIPRKPRRGRRSEAVAVEDFVRGSLERTFESIRKQNAGVLANKENIMKEQREERLDSDSSDSDDEDEDGDVKGKKRMTVEEDNPNWPVDADVGWGVRASEYFEKHPIKNVIGEDGFEIDWEGEIDKGWVKEINCLEWESFAFHPSPLVVLVFERYTRAADNWKALQELEKAAKVYWSAKDRLPPRTVKLDINIEKDLAYALKVREAPQILFLRGDKILYREKEIRTSDELVQMIAHFYYNAKKPSWIEDNFLGPRY